jgi:cytochrome c-type biogenesis protein CcmE
MDTPASPSLKRRAKFVIGAVVVAIAMVSLVGWAMSRPEATAYYVTVGELRSGDGPGTSERALRVNGTVVPGSIRRDGLATTFAIAEGGSEITVRTRAPLPDAFKAGSEVVARGTLDGGELAASEVLAKCPSKFKAA